MTHISNTLLHHHLMADRRPWRIVVLGGSLISFVLCCLAVAFALASPFGPCSWIGVGYYFHVPLSLDIFLLLSEALLVL
jgi:hypothetical protein